MKRLATAVAVAAMVMSMAAQSWATALSANRDTHSRSGEYVTMLVASGSVVYAGSMVCENGSAVAVPASDSSGYAVIGCAQEKADNSGVNYSATKTVKVRRGVFQWVNGGSVTDANVGDFAYVSDDQTVTTAASATYDIIAGVIIDVDSDGVWVDTYAIGGQGAASVTTLAASGASTLTGAVALGNTLSVAGVSVLTGAAHLASTLKVAGATTCTGAVTFVAMPVLTATNAAGAVAAGHLENLPTGATTNALFIKFGVGTNSYVVPAYALP